MTSSSEPTRSLFAASLGLALILCVLLALRGEASWSTVVAPLAALLVGGLVLQARAPRSSRALLALAVLNALLVIPEAGLRLADFRFTSGVQFGYPTPADFQEFAPDADLFWKLPAGDPHVNSLGFFGPEPAVPKPAGVFRVLFLGDSCLQQGFPESVPDIVAHLAEQERTPRSRRFEAINLSMSGYSSHQGLRLAETVGVGLDPDLVVIYYGWNDHWRAYGAVDREKAVALAREHMFHSSRLLQALRRLSVSAGDAVPLTRNRVPLEHYGENLTRLASLFRGRAVPVVLVTAPSAHRTRGVPDYLLRRGFAPDAESVLSEHAAYIDALEEVAAAEGAHVLDLAAEFEDGEDPEQVFVEDGIHFNERGRWAAARRVLDFLAQAGLDGQERGQ